jgi:hypothetical protein
VVPPRVTIEGERTDEIAMADVIQRVRLIHKAFDAKGKKANTQGNAPNIKGDKISFMSEIL